MRRRLRRGDLITANQNADCLVVKLEIDSLKSTPFKTSLAETGFGETYLVAIQRLVMAMVSAVMNIPVSRLVIVMIAVRNQRWTVPIEVWTIVAVVAAVVRPVRRSVVVAIDRCSVRTVGMSVTAMTKIVKSESADLDRETVGFCGGRVRRQCEGDGESWNNYPGVFSKHVGDSDETMRTLLASCSVNNPS